MKTNEPVAWMDYLEHSDVYDLNVSGRGIPLYTHPAKTLTDEEIIAEAEKQDWLGLKSDFEWQPEIDFARAILRKAQKNE